MTDATSPGTCAHLPARAGRRKALGRCQTPGLPWTLVRSLPLPDPGTPPLSGPVAYLAWIARRQWGILSVSVLLGVTGFFAQAITPSLVGRAIDAGLAHGLGPDLWRYAGMMGVLGLVSATTNAIGHRFDVQNWLRASYTASEHVGATVARSGDAITTELPTGEVVSAVANDALRVGELYATAARFIGSLVAYGVVAVLMLRISVQLGVVVLVGLPLVAGALGLLVRPLQSRQGAQREANGRLTTLGSDTVTGLRILRGIGGEDVFTARYAAQSQDVRRRGVQVALTQSWLDGLQVLLPGLFVLALVWLGARMAIAGTLSPGELVTTYGYAAFLSWPVQIATEMLQAATRATIGARKVLAVLRVQPSTVDRETTTPMPSAGAVLLDEVSGVVLEPGRVVGLVSADPDAAATVAVRLGRFDDEAEATTPVRLGGALLADLPKAELRRRVLVSTSTPALFSGPLRTELDVRGGTGDESLLAAIDLADARDVLDSVPDGLDGALDEKGRSLSGGQRQRLALARALLVDAPVLVLVEPTSAVDAHTEARIAEHLAASRRGRTTLVVTSSPLMLEHTDEVQLLVDGALVARGRHDDLLAGSAGDEVAETYRSVVGRRMNDEPLLTGACHGPNGPEGDHL
ncbi:MAG: ABC transporter ATP-binding protein/permease [Actinobacteria bacterium]|nr:ABC transporter ATP-binding protein/permease [Actinomycetota bacterium]